MTPRGGSKSDLSITFFIASSRYFPTQKPWPSFTLNQVSWLNTVKVLGCFSNLIIHFQNQHKLFFFLTVANISYFTIKTNK